MQICLKNITDNTLGKSYEESSKEEEYVCFISTYDKGYYFEVTSLTRWELFKVGTKLVKDIEKLEMNNIDLNGYIEFLKNKNQIFGEEISSIRSESLQSDNCESCEFFKNEVTSLHETLEKFTKGKNNIDLLLSNIRVSFNKNSVGYEQIKPLNNVWHAKKKSNCPLFKGKLYNKLIHLEPFCDA